MEKKDDTVMLPPEIKVTLETPDSETEDYVFSIKSVLGTFKDHARFIMITFMAFFLVSLVGAFLFNLITRDHTGFASALISYGFPEAEEGLDPLGGPLNVNMIQSPYVIGQALDYLGLRENGITVEDVRVNLTISGIVPHDTLDRILLIWESAERVPERLIELEEVFFHPTQFLLQLNRGANLANLSDQDVVDLLNTIIYKYSAYFIRAYSEFHFLDVIVGHFDQSEYDYFEIVRILRGTINNMISYTSAMQNTAPDFRSPSTQKTFGDIWANLDLLRAIDIQRVGGLVHVNNMSRNRERSANILEYDIVRFEMERDIARANAEHVLFLIKEVYEREQWVYHTEMSGYFTYHRFSDLHDNLIRDVRDFEFLANRLDVDIAFYQNRVDALRAAQNQANPQDVRFVEEAIPTLFESLREWEIIINQTVEDFLTLELYRDAVRLVSPIGFRSAFSAHLLQMVLITMAGSFAGLFLSILIALCRDASYDGYKQKHKLMKGNNYDSIE